MRTNPTAPKTIDEYIAGFPNDVQEILEKIRRTIREAAPDAEETIKYRMPTLTLISRIVKLRVRENLARAEAKRKKK